jgi:tetratricopeptide (TPR) repeat protein
MGIRKKLQIVTASYQVAAIMLLTPLSGMAEETPQSAPTGLGGTKLDNFEQVIYGAPRKNLSTDARLKALEIKLFGSAKSGSVDSRLAGIQKALAYGRGTATSPDFSPPLAPTLDTSGSSSKTASAPAYNKNESFDAGSSGGKGGSDSGYNLPDSTKQVADAMQLYTDGKPDQAEAAFRKIIANDPNNSDAYYNLGVIAEGRGDLKGALNDYKQAQRINPQDQDLRDTVTSVANKLATSGHQVASSSVAPSTAPPAAGGRHGGGGGGGGGHGRNGGGGGAGGDGDRARLKGMVDDASVKYKNGDYDGAIGELGQVANEAPGDPDVQFALGQAYKAKGDLGRARTAMARASSLDPNNTTYQDALAALTGAAAGGVANASGGTGITPFAGSHAQPSGGGGLSGFTSHAGSSMSRRLTRAVEYGIAGAAVGGLTGAIFRGGGGYGYGGYGYGRPTGYSSMRSGALRGAVTGSLLGLIFGR